MSPDLLVLYINADKLQNKRFLSSLFLLLWFSSALIVNKTVVLTLKKTFFSTLKL